MKYLKVERKWALVIALILTLAAVVQITSMDLSAGARDIGKIIGTFVIPGAFYFIAFAPKSDDEK
ncbi:conserved exported hypothetical protein [Weissella viridescens]|uniref:Uncharacterized protein n=1 Tax=Weissella viridescens TaxID=1629 RepID=A0A0R2H0E0_WEIVI|nr:hypothetical protein [Weissella viridescens]KRN46369.1 hypothetical protein IV50_GL000639 [Weissella viridescens]GEA95389.1 hypothetical protein WVI01_13120 [Weissella viridescens]SOB43060.1 conserved exported hypothetical protein [Weissella viridescens]SUP52485.1 Uncharacterised protein [Weissella viridescens]